MSAKNTGKTPTRPAPKTPERKTPAGKTPAGKAGAPLRAVPGWVPLASLVLSIAGLGVAAYLTFEHFTASKTLACSDNGVVNCLQVTTSDQSRFLGIPVALLGLLYFVGMTALCLPWAWRLASPLVWLGRLGAASVGALFVLYLVYAELFVIGKICLWCTGVHVLAILLFGVVVIGAALADPVAGAVARKR